MRYLSKLLTGLAFLGLVLGLGWVLTAGQARAAEVVDYYYVEEPGVPCGDVCGSYNPDEGCWCYILPPCCPE